MDYLGFRRILTFNRPFNSSTVACFLDLEYFVPTNPNREYLFDIIDFVCSDLFLQ